MGNTCIDSWDTTNNNFYNIESLQRGVIFVAYTPPNNHVASTKSNLEIVKWWTSLNTRIVQAIPVCVVCNYLCYLNTEVHRTMGEIVGMATFVWNSRTKIHLGNPAEW